MIKKNKRQVYYKKTKFKMIQNKYFKQKILFKNKHKFKTKNYNKQKLIIVLIIIITINSNILNHNPIYNKAI